MQVTSANIVADTAGAPVEGARARALRLLRERVNAARETAIMNVATSEESNMHQSDQPD